MEDHLDAALRPQVPTDRARVGRRQAARRNLLHEESHIARHADVLKVGLVWGYGEVRQHESLLPVMFVGAGKQHRRKCRNGLITT